MKIERRSEKKSPPKTNHQTRREDYSLGKEILTRFHDKSRFALQVGPVSAREEEGRIPPREMKEKYLAFAAYNFGRVCRESQRGAGADEDNPTPGAKVTTCLLLYQTTKPLKKRLSGQRWMVDNFPIDGVLRRHIEAHRAVHSLGVDGLPNLSYHNLVLLDSVK